MTMRSTCTCKTECSRQSASRPWHAHTFGLTERSVYVEFPPLRAELAILNRARSALLQVAFPRLEVDRVASCAGSLMNLMMSFARFLAAEQIRVFATSQMLASRVFATTLVCNLVPCGTCHR